MILPSIRQHCRALLWALTLLLVIDPINGLGQSYCSSQNTASDLTPELLNFQSLGNCAQDVCGPQGFAYGIVQFTSCWCSNYAPAQQEPISSCNKHCPGFPAEDCGNIDAGLYGYVRFGGVQPSGTAGPYYGGQTSYPPPSSAPPPSKTVKTVLQTDKVTRTVIQQKTHVVPVKVTKHTTKARTTIRTSLRLITITNGAGMAYTSTQIVYATAPAPLPAQPDLHQTTTGGLSGGAIAGIVIGVVLGLILLALIAFFLCWRPRRRDGNLNRNTSVLSKVGLLRSSSTRNDVGNIAAAGPTAQPVYSRTNIVAAVPPRIETTGLSSGNRSAEPSSAATANTMETRRGSRPLFVDQRLNPYALGQHENTSRTSIGTLQDNQDYSRPLEVRNPDPA